MKNIIKYSIGVACLLVTTSLRAHLPLGGTAEHNHLLFNRVETTMELVDKADGSTVYVTWKVLKPKADEKLNTYEVTITSRDPAKPINKVYSLLTLGFQGTTWATEITTVTPSGKVEFVPAWSVISVPLKAPLTIDPTGLKWDSHTNKEVLDDEGICMLRLSGSETFTFIVTEVDRPHYGRTVWDNGHSVGIGHDNMPPD